MKQDVKITLRLRWGHDADRQITVPIEIRKGSYSQRYELFIDNTHVGWVVKYNGFWEAHGAAEQFGGDQRGYLARETTRRDAIDWVAYRLADYARNNVLAQRAEEAYAADREQ